MNEIEKLQEMYDGYELTYVGTSGETLYNAGMTECDAEYFSALHNMVPEFLEALREKQAREDSRPLTLDELRERNMKVPIWDECLHSWCAVRGGQIAYFGGGNRPLQTGRFYDYPPKEGGRIETTNSKLSCYSNNQEICFFPDKNRPRG